MKNRTKTMSHTQLETLLNRLHLDHSKRSHVQEQYVRQKAGHYGESIADHYLQYLPQKHYLTIQDLRLFDGIHFFQIDAMVLCPEFILILEVKNYKGKLIFDLEHQQLFRKYNDQKDTFPDPFLQVEHQAIQLQRWLAQFNFPEIPICSFIVVASPNTVIKTHGRDRQQFNNRIVRAKNIYHSVTSSRP
ncbi:nuclease-related domain-containing protein [Halobacillus hunanensis]|uniref:nuclease-related domain-containing protein n=1 Tax=Halobacillus hunanensis TaxID=578214 RepID=UPI0009A89D69|nr:nuclease-related domain-containing protein [Halobacillus hunanensis]